MSLRIYPVVLDLVRRLSPVIRVLRARSSALADQMERALISIPLNVAEGAARQTLADKARAYAIALAECCEACAAIEIAGALGACSPAEVRAVLGLGVRLKNVLSRLVR